MLTEVMHHYRLARPPVDVGFYETEHHKQIVHDLRTTIMAGRLIDQEAHARRAGGYTGDRTNGRDAHRGTANMNVSRSVRRVACVSRPFHPRCARSQL